MAEVEREHLRRLDIPAVKGAIREAVARELEVFVHTIALLKPGGLPKTSSGKVQRRACRTALLDGTLNRVDIAPEERKTL